MLDAPFHNTFNPLHEQYHFVGRPFILDHSQKKDKNTTTTYSYPSTILAFFLAGYSTFHQEIAA
jgi:hypothetical protein